MQLGRPRQAALRRIADDVESAQCLEKISIVITIANSIVIIAIIAIIINIIPISNSHINRYRRHHNPD